MTGLCFPVIKAMQHEENGYSCKWRGSPLHHRHRLGNKSYHLFYLLLKIKTSCKAFPIVSPPSSLLDFAQSSSQTSLAKMNLLRCLHYFMQSRCPTMFIPPLQAPSLELGAGQQLIWQNGYMALIGQQNCSFIEFRANQRSQQCLILMYS